jgi:hypothetical protein
MSTRRSSTSMNATWLPCRPGLTHRSRTIPPENWALPAPMMVILTSVDIVETLRVCQTLRVFSS